MEKIESFITDSDTKQLPFYVELAGVTYPDAGYEIRRECSEFFVLEYVMEGSGTVKVDGKVFYPSKGDVYFLPKGSCHHYFASKETPFKKIWMNVNGDLCGYLIQAYKLSGAYLFENIEVYYLFEQFLAICSQKEMDVRELYDKCSIIFLEIIQELARHSVGVRNVNEYASKAKDYCDRNIYQKITVEKVAEHVSLSVSQLNRIFKREFGLTVYVYILNNKINTAKSLLAGTAMTVSEIAFLLKFTDEHYFSNSFKRKTGMTPTEFRRGMMRT